MDEQSKRRYQQRESAKAAKQAGRTMTCMMRAANMRTRQEKTNRIHNPSSTTQQHEKAEMTDRSALMDIKTEKRATKATRPPEGSSHSVRTTKNSGRAVKILQGIRKTAHQHECGK